MARLSLYNQVSLSRNEIYKIFRRRIGVLSGIIVFCSLGGVLVNLAIAPTYEAETIIRVKQARIFENTFNSELEINSKQNSIQNLTTYVEILKSRSVVEPLVMKNKGNEMVGYYRFINHLKVQMIKDTEILKIRVRAKSPEIAEENTRDLINSFVNRLSYLSKTEQAVYHDFLKKRWQKSKIELQNAEHSLENYKKQAKIVAPAEETKAVIERISAINQLNAENQVALAAAHTRLNNANNQLSLARANIVPKSLALEFQKQKLSQMKVNLVELLQKKSPTNPEVLKLKAEINETNQKLNAEISKIVNKKVSQDPKQQNLIQNKILAEVEIAAIDAQQQLIQKILKENEQELAKLPVKEQELARLIRNNTLAQEIYLMLAKRFEEAKINEVMQPAGIQIIDEPLASDKPIAPNFWLSLAIGLVSGCLLGSAMALYLENSRRMIVDADDVHEYLDLPVLGVIPEFGLVKVDSKYSKKTK